MRIFFINFIFRSNRSESQSQLFFFYFRLESFNETQKRRKSHSLNKQQKVVLELIHFFLLSRTSEKSDPLRWISEKKFRAFSKKVLVSLKNKNKIQEIMLEDVENFLCCLCVPLSFSFHSDFEIREFLSFIPKSTTDLSCGMVREKSESETNEKSLKLH